MRPILSATWLQVDTSGRQFGSYLGAKLAWLRPSWINLPPNFSILEPCCAKQSPRDNLGAILKLFWHYLGSGLEPFWHNLPRISLTWIKEQFAVHRLCRREHSDCAKKSAAAYGCHSAAERLAATEFQPIQSIDVRFLKSSSRLLQKSQNAA